MGLKSLPFGYMSSSRVSARLVADVIVAMRFIAVNISPPGKKIFLEANYCSV